MDGLDSAIAEFAPRVHGRVLQPSDVETDPYNTALVGFNRLVNKKPRLVVQCLDTSDVIESVRFARRHNLPLASKSGGHDFAGYSVSQDGLNLDLSLLCGVNLDVERKTVAVGPGARWVDVNRKTYPLGLATPCGGCEMVGVGGFVLGGGWGMLSRQFGLAADNLISAELVDAEGNVLTASESEHSDLFWALRGGGHGSFGVVTSMTLQLHAIEKVPWVGALVWPLTRAKEVLRAIHEIFELQEGPRELMLFTELDNEMTWKQENGRLRLCKPDEQPDGPSGGVTVWGHYNGDNPAVLQAVLGRLQGIESWGWAFAPDARDTIPYVHELEILAFFGRFVADTMYREPYVYYKTGFLDGEITDQSVEILVDKFADFPSHGSMLMLLENLGGKISDVPRTATAFVHRNRRWCWSALGFWGPDIDAAVPGIREEMAHWVNGYADTLSAVSCGEVYQNYTDADLKDWESAYYAENYQRLQTVKQRYDPRDFFHYEQSVRLPANGPTS